MMIATLNLIVAAVPYTGVDSVWRPAFVVEPISRAIPPQDRGRQIAWYASKGTARCKCA